MKLTRIERRISTCMMSRVLFVFITLLLAAESTSGQQSTVKRTGPSRYESEPIKINLPQERYSILSFSGSSYLVGKLSIVSTDKPVATLSFVKTLKAESQRQAEEFADLIEVNIRSLENELSISAETASSPPWSGTNWSGAANIEIALPRNDNLKIDIRTTAFSIDVAGPFAAVDISNSVGEIAVSKITNKTRVSQESGGVMARDCTGPVTISVSSGPISLSNVDGKLGTIKLRNANARLILESVRGEIDARCDNAMITGNGIRFEAGHSQLASGNSNIDINADEVNGDLTVRGENGTINFSLPQNTSASYQLQVDEVGRIYTRTLPMTVSHASRTRVVGTTGGKRNKIEIDMAGAGTINLEGRPVNRTSLR